MTTTAATADLLNQSEWGGRVFSDGWVDARDTIESFEPATGDSLGVAGAADEALVGRACESAARSQREWAATPFSDRVAVVRRASVLLEEHRPEIERWLIREG